MSLTIASAVFGLIVSQTSVTVVGDRGFLGQRPHPSPTRSGVRLRRSRHGSRPTLAPAVFTHRQVDRPRLDAARLDEVVDEPLHPDATRGPCADRRARARVRSRSSGSLEVVPEEAGAHRERVERDCGGRARRSRGEPRGGASRRLSSALRAGMLSPAISARALERRSAAGRPCASPR